MMKQRCLVAVFVCLSASIAIHSVVRGDGGGPPSCDKMPTACQTWGADNPLIPGICCRVNGTHQTGQGCGQPGTGGTLTVQFDLLFECGLQHVIVMGQCATNDNGSGCGGHGLSMAECNQVLCP
jgi:hypothetical protein